jgi:phosphoribosylanthranilate isomerase
MFQIKICGITTVADAVAAAEAGADAIGLNFYQRGPRYIIPARAAEIATAVPEGVLRVGLFVNASVAEIRQTAAQVELDLIQLHGNEPPDFVAALAPLPVKKAFRVGPDLLNPVNQFLSSCAVCGVMPKLVLLDASVAGHFGGTGQTFDWGVAREYASRAERSPATAPPLVLAGGLVAENVGQAIRQVRPMAVDTASGVERSVGVKDLEKMRQFVTAARAAFDSIAG